MEQWQERTSMLLGEETLVRFAVSKVMVVGCEDPCRIGCIGL